MVDVICRILRLGIGRKRSICFSSRLIRVLKVRGVDRTGAGRTYRLLIQHFCLDMGDVRLGHMDLAIYFRLTGQSLCRRGNMF